MPSVNEADPSNIDHWKYDKEPGDVFEGTIVELDEVDLEYGPRPIVTIDDGTGEELSWIVLHSQPVRKLAKLGPEEGDHIRATYKGVKEVRKAGYNPAHIFSITVTKPGGKRAGQVDWEAAVDSAERAEGDDGPQARPDAPRAGVGAPGSAGTEVPTNVHELAAQARGEPLIRRGPDAGPAQDEMPF